MTQPDQKPQLQVALATSAKPMMTAPSTPREVQEFVNRRGIRLRRQWGQSFLVEKNILDVIVNAANVSPADIVFEIGPGAGVLTERLLDCAGLVACVEIDCGLAAWIDEAFGERPNLVLLNRDVMGAHNCLADEAREMLQSALGRELEQTSNVLAPPSGRPGKNFSSIKVVANLPYSISSPVIIALLESTLPITSLTVMLSREVGRKIVAVPGDEDYGLLSILCALNAESRIVHKVSRTCFWPQPKIDSAIITMHRRAMLADRTEYEAVKDIARKLFQFRRKSLFAAAKHGFELDAESVRAWFSRASVDPAAHAEILDLHAFRRLAAALNAQQH